MKKIIKKHNLSKAGDRLKHLRALLQVSRAYIQDKYSIPEITLKSWENGKIQLTAAGVKRCAEVYRKEGLIVSEDWVLTGLGLDPMSISTVSKYFAEPSMGEIAGEDDEACMIRDANMFKKAYQNAVILIVSGDEMRPFYKPGDYVGGKMRSGKEIKKCVNRDCIVHLKNGSRYFRRLVKPNISSYNLTCLNPNDSISEPVMFDVEIESVAPVIWHRRKDD